MRGGGLYSACYRTSTLGISMIIIRLSTSEEIGDTRKANQVRRTMSRACLASTSSSCPYIRTYIYIYIFLFIVSELSPHWRLFFRFLSNPCEKTRISNPAHSCTERKNLIKLKRSRPMRYLFAANEKIYLTERYLLFESPRSLWNLVTLNQLKFYLNQLNVFACWNVWIIQVEITQWPNKSFIYNTI